LKSWCTEHLWFSVRLFGNRVRRFIILDWNAVLVRSNRRVQQLITVLEFVVWEVADGRLRGQPAARD
jgi:hypothetical protein